MKASQFFFLVVFILTANRISKRASDFFTVAALLSAFLFMFIEASQ